MIPGVVHWKAALAEPVHVVSGRCEFRLRLLLPSVVGDAVRQDALGDPG